MSAVLDTGAKVTVLNSNIYYSIPQQHRPSLKPAKRNLVVAEAGMKMATHGMATMSVELEHKHFTWEMYIAPIGDDFLLVCDMVDELDITINSKRGIQIDDNGSTVMLKGKQTRNCLEWY